MFEIPSNRLSNLARVTRLWTSLKARPLLGIGALMCAIGVLLSALVAPRLAFGTHVVAELTRGGLDGPCEPVDIQWRDTNGQIRKATNVDPARSNCGFYYAAHPLVWTMEINYLEALPSVRPVASETLKSRVATSCSFTLFGLLLMSASFWRARRVKPNHLFVRPDDFPFENPPRQG
jgi:hypothetical protein